jgi:hypothetical protein
VQDEHLPIMEGSHAEPVRQAPDPDAMALLSDACTASHATQDPLQASKSPIANLVHLDSANLILTRRYTSIAPVSSLDCV